MNAKQMVESVQEYFPQKNGLRILRDLNAELRRYAEDVRCFRGKISLFDQELATEQGDVLVTNTFEPIRFEPYGSVLPLPGEAFIVRAVRVTGSLYVDINGRLIYLYQDRAQQFPLEITASNVDNYGVELDCITYAKPLSYDNEDSLGSHADAIVAGVIASYFANAGRYQDASFWRKEATALRRKAKEANTTDGSFGYHANGLLTPPKDRR